MKTLLAALLAAGALLLGAAPSPVGAAPSRHPHGIVSHTSAGSNSTVRATPRTTGNCSGSDCSGYETAINQYFTDVAHDSGLSSNVYSVDTQYSDGTGHIAYNSTFGGSYVDTTPYPASGCSDGAATDTECLTDAQLQQEILNDISANSWPEDTTAPTHLYFIFTPSNVGICFNSGGVSGNQCSTNVFCAYHDNFKPTLGTNVAYAVEPDNATIPTGGCYDPGVGQGAPNGVSVDPTINTTSHEMNEAITDPWPETSGGWWANDSNKDEIGDLCAWGFGVPLGSGYNQVINGHHYSLQQEYSNAANAGTGGCVQQLGGTATPITDGGTGPLVYQGGSVMRTNTVYAIYWVPPAPPPPSAPANTAAPIVSGVAAVGKTLTTSAGAWTNSPTTYAYQWQQCSATGAGCTNISGADSSLYTLTADDAGHEIRSEVSAENAGVWSSPTPSAASEVVVPVPDDSVAPAVSGIAAVGHTLSTTQGSWNTPVSYAYQWLRCSGSNCSAISGASASTYVPVPADAGYTLEAQVLATNAAATTAASSAPTATVIGVPAATKLPHVSGRAKVGKKLSVSTGTWSSPPARYRYQWLRCSAKGTKCAPILGAKASIYKLTKKDAKHRLRVQVTAVNVAGSTAVRSPATRTVPAPKPAKRR